MTKTFQIILFLLVFSLSFIELKSQQQVKIPWPSLANSPWPVLRGDMQGTGRSEYIGPRTNNVIWRKDMPLGVIYGPVIGYDDNLYMGERAFSLDTVNYFYCLDKDGNNKWTFETETSYANNVGPLIGSDSTIYFGSRNNNLYAMEFNGQNKWISPNLRIGLQLFISIALNGDLFIPAWDTINVVSQSGILKKKIAVQDLWIRGIVFSPSGDTMYYFDGGGQGINAPGNLHSSDLEGNNYWTIHLDSHNWGTPLIDNQNKIYIFGRDTSLSKSFLYCFKPNGSVDWKYEIFSYNLYTGPTMDKNGNIIFHAFLIINGVQKSVIISLDYSGNLNWITTLDLGINIFDNWINHELVCDAEGKVYCGSSNGPYFYCLDSDGTILWTLDIGDLEYDSCPAIGSDGTLYIGSHISSTFPYHTQNLIAVKDKPNSISEYTVVNEYNLFQNFPNPFNPSTVINYAVKEAGLVRLKVYDILGAEVAELVNETKEAGNHTIEFNASQLPSGVYIYTLQVNGFTGSKKMLLMK